jgi:uncharacterized DUF497 family protein
MEFEWDPDKNEANIRKHSISFAGASRVLAGTTYRERSDREGEQRWIAVGPYEGRLVTVVYTRRGEIYRIISARRAREHERRKYRQI